MSRKYPPGEGFKRAMREATAGMKIVPGLSLTEVYHEVWCDYDERDSDTCTCKPDIIFRPIIRPKDN